MAFESITRELLSRADEARDPGSGDAYLRIDHAGEATLKLSGICLLSEAVYRSGSEPAKNLIAAMMAGRAAGWASVFEIAGRLPREHALVRRLTEPPPSATRLHEVCILIEDLLRRESGVTIPTMPKPKSIAWRHVMRVLTTVRNKVKGHGAPPPELYAKLNPLLRELVGMAAADVLDAAPPALAYLRPTRDGQGLFLDLGVPNKERELAVAVPTLQPGDVVLQSPAGQVPLVPLAYFEERPRKLWIYNDSASESTGELAYIDYREGHHAWQPNHFVTRHGFAQLPSSETSAAPVLRADDGAAILHNLPARRPGHVSRPALEDAAREVLIDDLHRVVTLDGRGGIGKTYLAVEVCHQIASDAAAADRFAAIVWVSGRDIDLTAAGPKPVRQDVVTLEDVLRFVLRACGYEKEASDLAGPALRAKFTEACRQLHPLVVLDNFETYADPERLFRELDKLVPNGAKVLVTSRHREYCGEYAFTVPGMTEQEGKELILREARAVLVAGMFETEDRIRRVYETAQGHPYSMRLIVGQVARGKNVYDACAEVAKSTEVLKALFERSLRLAEPGDVELAAVLAELRGACPLEALMLLPIPRSDVEDAVGRLFDLSLIERVDDRLLRERQYVCPKATGEYIRHQGMFESPAARSRVEGFAAKLRDYTQVLRTLAKKTGAGEKTAEQAAEVMMQFARRAIDKKDHDLARRAVDVAVSFAGDDAGIVAEAALLYGQAGSASERVSGMLERALDLAPDNATLWVACAKHKTETRAPIGQVMTCYERALEADRESLPAAVGFAHAVLEVCAQEEKLGERAVRPNDPRKVRTLLGKSRTFLDERLGKLTRDMAAREKVLVAKGWIAVKQEGASETVRQILMELQRIAPKSAQARALADGFHRAETAARGGGNAGS